MYDLVIIGSGPAGLSAAVYAKRACLDVVVLEKEPMGGRQMIYTQEVDNYLGLPETNGFDLAQKFEPGKIYTEKQVNVLLNQWHTFEDPATLRRELYQHRFLGRQPSGAAYWLEPTLEELQRKYG